MNDLYRVHLFGWMIFTGTAGGDPVGYSWGGSPQWEEVKAANPTVQKMYTGDLSTLLRYVRVFMHVVL